jgi:hypothetical protein
LLKLRVPYLGLKGINRKQLISLGKVWPESPFIPSFFDLGHWPKLSYVVLLCVNYDACVSHNAFDKDFPEGQYLPEKLIELKINQNKSVISP